MPNKKLPKLVLTQKFLMKEYIEKRKSIRQIEQETKHTLRTISKYLDLHEIPKRTHSEATRGHGKKEKRIIDLDYYCKKCGAKIHWSSGLYHSGLCKKCSSLAHRNPERHKTHYCKETNCNNIITYQTYKFGGGRCLSCAIKESSKDSTRHYNWQGGKSFEPYPLGWTRTFKEQIRYRDGYKCQICGVPEAECGRKLDVHHIDYDKENLSLNNLISLCKSCHMKTNYNREYWKSWLLTLINEEE